ncbi:hypothetical protein GCM10029992_29960 [Glycomyces albus]
MRPNRPRPARRPARPAPRTDQDRKGLTGYGAALRQIHRPESFESLGAAKKRLKWQEALVMQAALVRRKATAAVEPATPTRRAARSPRPSTPRCPSN